MYKNGIRDYRDYHTGKDHLNIFRVIWGDRKTANFDEHMTGTTGFQISDNNDSHVT